MERKKIVFWIFLAIINVLGLGYAVRLYAQAGSETHAFATFVLVVVILILGVADIRSAMPR